MPEDHEQLRRLIRSAPTLEATAEQLRPECEAAEKAAASLRKRLDEIESQLAAVEKAKATIAAANKRRPTTAPSTRGHRAEPATKRGTSR